MKLIQKKDKPFQDIAKNKVTCYIIENSDNFVHYKKLILKNLWNFDVMNSALRPKVYRPLSFQYFLRLSNVTPII